MVERAYHDKRFEASRIQRVHAARAGLQAYGCVDVHVLADEGCNVGARLLVAVERRRAEPQPQRRDALRAPVVGERLQLVEVAQHGFGFGVEGLAEERGVHAAAFAHEQLVLQFPLKVRDSF